MTFGTYETSYGYPSIDEPVLPRENSVTDENIGHCREIDSPEAFEQCLQDYDIVIVDVWANFCSPCKMITPMYENLAAKYYVNIMKKEICFLKDCIDDNSKEAIHGNQIAAVPTFFIYVKGNQVTTITGGDMNRLDKILDTLLTNENVTILEPNYNEKLLSLEEKGIIERQTPQLGKMNQTHHGVY